MKYKILEMLKKYGGYVSGEKISEELGITRSAVWKHMNALKRDGYDITSCPSKGYVLDEAQDKLSPAQIAKHVPGKLYFYKSTTSTNDEAKRTKDAPDKSVFIAETQTAARGRLGRSWASRGNGLWMSIYLKPDIPPCNIAQLTLIAGIAVSRVIENSKIKWPNDILIDGRKVCGILTEMTAEADRITSVIIGIGINVNTETFSIDLIRKATSLYIETKVKQDRNEFAGRILDEFWSVYDEYVKNGFREFKREYKIRCTNIQRDVVVIKNGEEITARAVDINERGELVCMKRGDEFSVNSGEVSVRGLLGYN